MTTIPRPATLPSDLLRQGWCQGAAMRDGRYCLRGAFCKAIMGSPISSLPQEVVDVLYARVTNYAPITFWNDAPERTQAEVVADAEAAQRLLGWRV